MIFINPSFTIELTDAETNMIPTFSKFGHKKYSLRALS